MTDNEHQSTMGSPAPVKVSVSLKKCEIKVDRIRDEERVRGWSGATAKQYAQAVLQCASEQLAAEGVIVEVV